MEEVYLFYFDISNNISCLILLWEIKQRIISSYHWFVSYTAAARYRYVLPSMAALLYCLIVQKVVKGETHYTLAKKSVEVPNKSLELLHKNEIAPGL